MNEKEINHSLFAIGKRFGQRRADDGDSHEFPTDGGEGRRAVFAAGVGEMILWNAHHISFSTDADRASRKYARG